MSFSIGKKLIKNLKNATWGGDRRFSGQLWGGVGGRGGAR
jgi:hypothetical protein